MNAPVMTAEELAAIEARAKAATQGPWWVGPKYYEQSVFCKGGTFANFAHDPDAGKPLEDDQERVLLSLNGNFAPRGDAAFIAHAREDVPRLLAALAHMTKVAEAQAAARKAEEEVWLFAIGGADPARMEALRQARKVTHDKLRALGVEP